MSRELVGVLPITDAEIKATRLLAGELLSHPDVVRVCDALLEARAAIREVLIEENMSTEVARVLRALLSEEPA